MAKNYWLLKSEPSVYSIDDLARDRTGMWDGVRNYQARNFMRDVMRPGDLFLFYHSSADAVGVAGIGRIASRGVPDTSAVDKKSEYYDPRKKNGKNPWVTVKVSFVKKFPRMVLLADMRREKALKDMLVLKRGMRLSVQPVSREHFAHVLRLAEK